MSDAWARDWIAAVSDDDDDSWIFDDGEPATFAQGYAEGLQEGYNYGWDDCDSTRGGMVLATWASIAFLALCVGFVAGWLVRGWVL